MVSYSRIPDDLKRSILGENMANLLGISLESLVQASAKEENRHARV
jgi:hypothetical protein